MTEFITRSCKAESRYEVIVKTDSEEHYKATEDFARRLIDPVPKTNADRIRAMSDEELAKWLVKKTKYQESAWSEPSYLNFLTESDDMMESAIKGTTEWLKQPAEGE